MKCDCALCRACETREKCASETIALFPGIELRYVSLTGETPPDCARSADYTLLIWYCRRGSLAWRGSDNRRVALAPDDCALNAAAAWGDLAPELGGEAFEGLCVSVDLKKLTEQPAALIAEANVTGEALWDKYCTSPLSAAPADDTLRALLQGLYAEAGDASSPLRLSWRRARVIELLLWLSRPEPRAEKAPDDAISAHTAEQVAIIREIHEDLTHHIETRVTIEELSRRYLMNPTTLKTVFKSVYGTSLAAHMKEHRMGLAAQLLRESDLSIAEIAQRVGYESQSKLTAAFKEYFGMPPKEYRQRR